MPKEGSLDYLPWADHVFTTAEGCCFLTAALPNVQWIFCTVNKILACKDGAGRSLFSLAIACQLFRLSKRRKAVLIAAGGKHPFLRRIIYNDSSGQDTPSLTAARDWGFPHQFTCFITYASTQKSIILSCGGWQCLSSCLVFVWNNTFCRSSRKRRQ